MVKKFQNKLRIDFARCVIEDRLLQVKNHKASNELSLVNTWSISIPPQASKGMISLVREFGSKDPVSLSHIKRIQKISDKELGIIVCSKEYLDSNEIAQVLEENKIPYWDLKVQMVPKNCPSTKDLAIEWGSLHWPLIWKGNPNDQILNDVIVDVDIVKSHLLHVSEESQKIEDALPITAAIVDPVDNKVISLSRDERHIHPLNHSVMRCVQNVALYEQERRKSCSKEEEHYLCENYHVYTTHEPCTMCSMALIHSRVSRLIYLKQMPETGALNPKSGEGYVIQEHKLLNSSYEVWEWLGDEYPVKSLDSSTNA